MKPQIPEPIVPEGWKYRTINFHTGNTKQEDLDYISQVANCRYATLAYIWLPTSDVSKDDPDAQAWCFCSPLDNPSRKKGTILAVHRAIKKLNPTFYRDLRRTRKHS